MARHFRYSSDQLKTLSNNFAHNFALSHTLSVFDSKAAYTFIPKNGCSTMRYSIARANGCLEAHDDMNWIHSNNKTFSMDNVSAATAKYTFVILRCPFERLYSAYMDKIVGLTAPAWTYYNSQGRRIRPYDLTFDKFVESLVNTPKQQMDIHWRPQVDFLLYKNYDNIFCLEQFGLLEKTLLDKIDLQIFDTRSTLQHDSKKLIEESTRTTPRKLTALELLVRKEAGYRPKLTTLIDEEIAHELSKVYHADIELYCSHFGKSKTMNELGL